MDQSWAAQQYMKVDPDASSGDQTVTLDRRRYCRQTMFAVNKELRHVFHANHVCIISVGGVHIAHTEYQRFGAHNMWQAFCFANLYALIYHRHEIQTWLLSNKIETTDVVIDADGTEVHINQLPVMVDKYKRWCE